ncbi:hypothetical protein [Fibrella forsythiae]|nr:hypothetical protein [Fibrella forsythiae]
MSATPGAANTFIASQPNSGNTGTANTFIGRGAGTLNYGSNNTYVGYIAGLRTTGSNNTYMGFWAGYSLNGEHNVVIGRYAGCGGGLFSDLSRSKGSYNVYLGSSAGYGGYPDGTNHNVVVGDSAGYNNATSGSVFVGSKSGYTNRIGRVNTYLGFQSGYSAVADSNTFVGYQSGYATTTGRGNTFIGTASGRSNSGGSHNTFVGNGAGPAGSNSDDNVYIGYNTEQRDTDALATNLHNSTAIGSGSKVAISNALVLGNNVNVGIGTSAPATRLEVVSSLDNTSGLRLSHLTANSQSTHSTDQFLTVNDQGDIIKARYQLRINKASEWSDRVFAPSYQLRSLESVERYVRDQGHLPGVPSADEVMKEGVDLAKINALLLEKVEELTLYLLQQKRELMQQQKRIDQLEGMVNSVAKP